MINVISDQNHPLKICDHACRCFHHDGGLTVGTPVCRETTISHIFGYHRKKLRDCNEGLLDILTYDGFFFQICRKVKQNQLSVHAPQL